MFNIKRRLGKGGIFLSVLVSALIFVGFAGVSAGTAAAVPAVDDPAALAAARADLKAALAQAEAADVRKPPAAAGRVCYRAHVQDIGWQSEVCDGQIAGTVGQSKRMEAVSIRAASDVGSICYAAYVQGDGWQRAVCDGDIAGTVGQSKAMEALMVEVYLPLSVCYEAHMQNLGWLKACDGHVAGRPASGLRMEATRIIIV